LRGLLPIASPQPSNLEYALHILIDLQPLQTTGSGTRGIGRYARALIDGMMLNAPNDHFTLLLNGMIGTQNGKLRRSLRQVRPDIDIQMWTAAPPTSYYSSDTHRRHAAEAIYKAAIAKIEPDVVLVASIFEGLGEDIITAYSDYPTAVVLYDLIPFIFPDIYLGDSRDAAWYEGKFESLKRANTLLAISEFSAQDGRAHLNIPSERIVTIGTDADAIFEKRTVSVEARDQIAVDMGLTRPFLMYTGGPDERKNISGLIEAYSALPDSVIKEHHLAIVGRVTEKEEKKLTLLARKVGLSEDDVVFTGYVSDDMLITLYNSCKAFVFPSWYEGFGLPVLEAMRCGAPVIGSSASSLPEVIGRSDALFDPHSPTDMARVIENVLTDKDFRQSLCDFALEQSTRFSWDETAVRALDAMRKMAGTKEPSIATSTAKPRLAFVSSLPPERSGISIYKAELLSHLSQYYEIDLIVPQKEVDLGADNDRFPVRSVAWFEANGAQFDRVLYQFDNSEPHAHLPDLLDKFPGTVELHDFFSPGHQNHMSTDGFIQTLAEDHGYDAVLDFIGTDGHLTKVRDMGPVNGRVLRAAEGVIVHSKNSHDMVQKYYGAKSGDNLAEIPHLCVPAELTPTSRDQARKILELAPDTLLICSFGDLSENKPIDKLIDGFELSAAAKHPDTQLVFVGDGTQMSEEISKRIEGSTLAQNVKVTGQISQEMYQTYLHATDFAIQLGISSQDENLAEVLNQQNHGVPLIVNALGSLADLPTESVLHIPDDFSNTDLSGAIDSLADDPKLRKRIGSAASELVATKHAPTACAQQYRDAIERFHLRYGATNRELFAQLAELPADPGRDIELAQAVADSFPTQPRLRQLFVDVSIIAHSDPKTGVQRVVRAILSEILQFPPVGWRIEPVYFDNTIERLRYARNFTCRFLNIPTNWAVDEPVDFAAGDRFIGLDLNFDATKVMKEPLGQMASAGVEISFVIYDLLPVRLPQYFTPELSRLFEEWLEFLSNFDRVVCISKAVADDFRTWLSERNVSPALAPDARWFHLGADVSNSVPTKGLPDGSNKVLSQLAARPSFLMVGTIEPRKGYEQALSSFEQLWADGVEANFVIVGGLGWNVDSLVERLRSHPEKGIRLFWLSDISDEFLEKIYAASDCLIAASHGEGFGLPLIEAARHSLPILARDLPVFREVAGCHAAYFDGFEPQPLANAIRDWLSRKAEGETIRSDDLQWITWKTSAAMFLDALNIETKQDTPQPD
jgi:glycosyltransferase involved in cell wall biosynthesis